MGLTRLAINRPLTILMFIVSLVIMGGVAYGLLKVDRMPAISVPFVNVSVSYPGATPEDVEDLIVSRLEQAVSGVPGIESIDSDSNEGRGSVRITFVEGWDADKAAVDVDRRIAAVRSRLPADAGSPNVNKADPNSFPILNVSLTGQLPMDELYSLAATMVQPRLQSIPGVADVSVSGGVQREVRIRLDYTRAEAYGISPSTISSAISRENLNAPGGTLSQGRSRLNIRTVGTFQSADELADLVVASTASGPVFLRDVATVTEAFKDRTSYQRLNGEESVGLSITKSSEANSLKVADDLRSAISALGPSLPAGAKLVISNDSSRFTRAALDAIQRDLVLAVFLCASVLLLFLHAWRNTLIVILAIPTSLVTTFLVMYAAGITLNTISMMALALTIGILVDDSIVVLENIHRHLKMGDSPREAALKGRSEIGLAAIAITLTDMVVYLPVAFMSGTIGQLFREYGLTIATATLISLFISFTLTPMLASRWMKSGNGNRHGPSRNPLGWFPAWWEGMYERVARGYGRILSRALRARPLIVMIGVLAFAAALSFIPLRLLGVEYAPAEDDNQLNVSISLPVGSGLDAYDQAVRQLEDGLFRIAEVQNVFTSVRGGGGGGMGGGSSLSVQLVNKDERSRTVWEIANEIRRMGTSIPDGTVRANASSSLGFGGGGGGGQGLRIDVLGDDLDTLKGLVAQVAATARRVPGVLDVRTPDVQGEPELRAKLDHRRMAEMGITAQQVSTTLRTMLSGSLVGELRPEGRDQMDITLVATDTDRLDLARLESMPLITQGGATVRLGQVATLERASGPLSISRSGRQRVLSLNATVDGRPLSEVSAELKQALKDVPMPTNYRAQVTGSVRQMEAAIAALTQALTLSIILIYMLLVALYESWLYPLAIMLSLPVSLIGAFGGLVLTGNTLNIFSMIGMIMLMGLVAKNAILLVDYTNTLRARGIDRGTALVQAGETRLRPILMTTFTIIAAMTPLAMKIESGAESRAPMAVVVIGGVISSTLLTLVLVPTVYSYLDDLQTMLGNPKAFSFLRRRSREHPAILGSERP